MGQERVSKAAADSRGRGVSGSVLEQGEGHVCLEALGEMLGSLGIEFVVAQAASEVRSGSSRLLTAQRKG